MGGVYDSSVFFIIIINPPPSPPPANCTLSFVGRSSSCIPLAECGCLKPTSLNNLPATSQVDPPYILDAAVAAAQTQQCPNNAVGPNCSGVNSTPVCQAINSNNIYGGAYDRISTYTPTPIGGFDQLCTAPLGVEGLYAQCMTAACYDRPAFDGAPVTCYCPVYSATAYFLGSRNGTTASCEPNLPYVLSGADASFGP